MRNTRCLKPFGLLFLLCLLPVWALAQTITVKGVVKDATGQTVIGASVLQKGTSNGTITDFEGSFTLEVPSDAVLTISFVGYKTQEIKIAGKTSLNVTLEEDAQMLDNVIVVGYGTQKKEDLTSAIATLSPKEVLKSPGGITDALQGSTAGVNVSGGKIRIRGTASITGSTDPLWVVDGIIDASGNIPNDDEIESIQVLKDAASCAIYGVRGANGVILVTTKKGKEGKPRISFNAYAGFGSPTKKVEMLNAYDYGIYVNELYYNSSSAASIADGTWNQIVPTGVATPSTPMADTDWWNEYFCNTNYQKYDVSVSGGSKYANYRIGATHTDNDDQMHKNDAKVDNIYANVEGTIGRLTYGGRIFANYSRTNGFTGASLMNMLLTSPNLPVYNEDGTFFHTGNNGRDGNDMANQAWYLHNQRLRNRSVSTMGSIFGEIKIFDWLKYRLTYTYSYARNNDATIVPKYDLGTANARQDYNSQTSTKGGSGHEVIENLLTFDKTFNDIHSLSGVVGIVSEKFEGFSTAITGRSNEYSGFGIESRYPDSQIITSSQYNEAYFSYLARVMYSYNSKYMITANFRADESSKFADGNRWGYFPSFSIGWRVSEEKWMKDATSHWLDNLKIRATLGWIGSANAVGRYDYQSVVETDNRYYTFGPGQINPDGSVSNAPAPLIENFANPDLSWETTRDAGVGFDLDMFHNKLSFVFDYYNRKTTDMLLAVQLPRSTGNINTVYMNVGSMTNWGIELAATYREKIGDFSFTISPNFSLYRNKVTSLGSNQSLAGGSSSTGNVTMTVAGRPVAQFWGYKTDGLFRTDEEAANYVNDKGVRLQESASAGDIKYVDLNGDGVISDDDKTFIGSSLPDCSFGLNITAEYKGFDFSMLWQGDFGNQIYNNWKTELMGGYAAKNQMLDMGDRFRAHDVTFTTAGGETITLPANTNTDVARAVLNDPNGNHTKASDYFIENGSYFRCNRITLGYTFDKNLLSKIHIESLRLYMGVKNPFTITGYSMFDPQVPNGGSTLNRGVDGAYYYSGDTYWATREFFAGIQLTF
ncbi:TonB-dependent receptor [Bacteroides gallinaceum]|uniref:SusC/RagA family TonB-linked outer membrane protein n=1 Tax=Bacteroides gallinaceum TaxID=1462571 RepID=UPI0003415157|nr:TonB-dependent receptor [Bacteroides gallinaceum]MDM8154509.1 TonB-dependent receptor [Bacteroides gallinaceum]CCZ70818.1 tonB-linked outer membrane protein SusC/RagA family [Bacteroides sp. CAG:702]